MGINEKFRATEEVHLDLYIFLSERRDVSEQDLVSGLKKSHH
jgi:hypothetical protein